MSSIIPLNIWIVGDDPSYISILDIPTTASVLELKSTIMKGIEHPELDQRQMKNLLFKALIFLDKSMLKEQCRLDVEWCIYIICIVWWGKVTLANRTNTRLQIWQKRQKIQFERPPGEPEIWSRIENYSTQDQPEHPKTLAGICEREELNVRVESKSLSWMQMLKREVSKVSWS